MKMVAGGTKDRDLHELVKSRLRQVDQRYTPGRRAIVELLLNAGHPVNITDIAENLPELPRSSAYRHLVDLEGAGLVRRIASGDEFARFELAEDLTEHHHHLLCVDCGKVIDVTPTAEFEGSVSETIDQLAASQGFVPHGHRLDVLGVCAGCR
jgi:Fur family transcriptional regulator, ferric uptake regulator